MPPKGSRSLNPVEAQALRSYLESGDLSVAARVVQQETGELTFDYDVLPMITDAAEEALPVITKWGRVVELLTAMARHAGLIEDMRRIRATGKLLFESVDRHAGGPLERIDEESGDTLGLDAQGCYFLGKSVESYANAVAKLDARLEAVTRQIAKVADVLRRERIYVAGLEAGRKDYLLKKFGAELIRSGMWQPALAFAEAADAAGGEGVVEAVFDAWEAGRLRIAADKRG